MLRSPEALSQYALQQICAAQFRGPGLISVKRQTAGLPTLEP